VRRPSKSRTYSHEGNRDDFVLDPSSEVGTTIELDDKVRKEKQRATVVTMCLVDGFGRVPVHADLHAALATWKQKPE